MPSNRKGTACPPIEKVRRALRSKRWHALFEGLRVDPGERIRATCSGEPRKISFALRRLPVLPKTRDLLFRPTETLRRHPHPTPPCPIPYGAGRELPDGTPEFRGRSPAWATNTPGAPGCFTRPLPPGYRRPLYFPAPCWRLPRDGLALATLLYTTGIPVTASRHKNRLRGCCG